MQANTATKAETMVVVDDRFSLIGRCVHTPGQGWRFLPNTSGRRPSRRAWPSAVDCVPAWAMKLSDEMLAWTEYEAEKAHAAEGQKIARIARSFPR